MPCSPVHVPSIASARETIRSLRRLASAFSSGFSGSIIKIRWKLPSPTWPASAEGTVDCARSRLVSAMHSASREIGTQTSVGQPLEPRLPQFPPRLRRRRPAEIVAAMLGRDRLDEVGLLGDAGLGAMKFEEQSR